MTEAELQWAPDGSWSNHGPQRRLAARIAELPEAVFPYVAWACLEAVQRYRHDARFTPEQQTALLRLGRAVDEVFGRPPGETLP